MHNGSFRKLQPHCNYVVATLGFLNITFSSCGTEIRTRIDFIFFKSKTRGKVDINHPLIVSSNAGYQKLDWNMSDFRIKIKIEISLKNYEPGIKIKM